jgi:hypothetical protein
MARDLDLARSRGVLARATLYPERRWRESPGRATGPAASIVWAPPAQRWRPIGGIAPRLAPPSRAGSVSRPYRRRASSRRCDADSPDKGDPD